MADGATVRRSFALRLRLVLRAGPVAVLPCGSAPSLLESRYRQESVGLVNGLFPSRAEVPFEHYLDRRRELARMGALRCGAICFPVLFRRRIRLLAAGRSCPRRLRTPAPPPGAAEGTAPWSRGRGALTVPAVAAIAASACTARIGFHPLSSIPLFIAPQPLSGIVQYHKAIVYHEDGTGEESPFDRWFGSMGKFRFRPIVESAFRGLEGRERARKFRDGAARAADTQSCTPRPVRFELQRRRWSLANGPGSPDRGVRVDRYTHLVGPLRSAR